MSRGDDPFPLAAVDVGNSRVKFGLFDKRPTDDRRLPQPDRTLEIDPRSASWDGLATWLERTALERVSWRIGSVQRAVASRLIDTLQSFGAVRITLLSSADLPLNVEVPHPERVGIDRLLGAAAANRVRRADTAAVVIDLGTAITVDLVSAAGAFLGGAILPGIGMSARALHEFTDLLPLIDMQSLAEPPPAVGDATLPAMKSGLFWGAVGGVRQLIELFAREVGHEPQVFLTGGAAPSVAQLLPGEARYEPNLVLAGIALTALAVEGS